MNTVEKLNAIIDYVEDHLCENIDMEVISKIAYLSAYDTQRMFSFITEMSLSEYIRKRRLTLAGAELRNQRAKVIDIALKYGYDSPVSFARAFQAFHGMTPSMAKSTAQPLRSFSRLVFQISAKEVMSMIRSEKMTVNGKEYDASYYGEANMSSWSEVYNKRCYWRLENAYDDFKDCFKLAHVLPYNNYPSIRIQPRQVFVIDYYCKSSDKIERKYYISCGEVWNGMECTTEIAIHLDPLRLDKISVEGKTYTAEFYGDQYIGNWSKPYVQRSFWRLRNAYADFKDKPLTGDVLPYNNYNPMKIEVGQVFVIDYLCKDGETTERRYYISNGCIWNDLPCTAEVKL